MPPMHSLQELRTLPNELLIIIIDLDLVFTSLAAFSGKRLKNSIDNIIMHRSPN